MKKTFALCVIFTTVAYSVCAAPFGLSMGMTLEEIADACNGEEPMPIEGDCYLVKPTKSHPLFEYYAVYVSEKYGLYEIIAATPNIKTNRYGTELQNAFNTLKDRIAKTYGKPRIVDEVDPNISSYYRENEYWFYTLEEGSRMLYALWGADETLDDNLKGVALNVAAGTNLSFDMLAALLNDDTSDVDELSLNLLSGLSGDVGTVWLYYYFINSDIVEDEQDDVF